MTAKANLPFKPDSSPLGTHGAPVCRQELAGVLLRRSDNLGRPLSFRDAGKIMDAAGQTKTAELIDGEGAGRESHLARFERVTTGEARWHWPDDPAGEHLIGLDTVSRQFRCAPVEALSKGIELDVIPSERRATAVHLPPPVIINLREESSPESDLLTDDQLSYFQANGNNALVFVHGYNVPHGRWGRFLESVERSGEYHGNTHSFRRTLNWLPVDATVWQNPEAFADEAGPAVSEDDLNGTGLHNWAVNMEYHLNRAAGFDGEDWTPYSRIINISWPGDTGATDFMQAELNAMAAGRRLVPLLQQLRAAGIKVNLITHSLGARVALTALNMLGTLGQGGVDHLFLWQPAVADNALTNNASRDVHPLGLGVFPAAHQAARRIVVLHTLGDGILGPGNPEDEPRWRKAMRRVSPIGVAAAELAGSEDSLDDLLGYLHGAYEKKWWTFPSFLDNGFGPAIEKLYSDYLPLSFDNSLVAHPQRSAHSTQSLKQKISDNWARLEQDILDEAAALWQPCVDCVRNGQRPPRYTLLAPLNHRASISVNLARDYVRHLRKLAMNRWVPERQPRPALGYLGFEEVAGEKAGTFRDEFIEEALRSGRWFVVDQSRWLFSHSGMRVPSEELFEEIYRREIMENRLLATSSFGRY